MDLIAEMIHQCPHIPNGAFLKTLPSAWFDGAPLMRIENLPGSYVVAVSHQKVVIWCSRCFVCKFQVERVVHTEA